MLRMDVKQIGLSFLFLGVCGLSSCPVGADEIDSTANKVLNTRLVQVHVRAVRGQNDPNGHGYCDDRLSDIKDKLKRLHYQNFRLVADEDRSIALNRRTTINITPQSTLTLRPLYMEDGKIGMWIKWRDSEESSLLDTRVHLVPGQSMLIGAEDEANLKDASAATGGIILAIEVKPSTGGPLILPKN